MRGPLLPISTPRLMALEWSGALGVFLVLLGQQVHDFKAVGSGWIGQVLVVLAVVGGIGAIATSIASIALALPGVTTRRERRIRIGAVLAMLPFVYIVGAQVGLAASALFPDEKMPEGTIRIFRTSPIP